MKKTAIVVLIVLLCFSLLLAACQNGNTSTSTNTTADISGGNTTETTQPAQAASDSDFDDVVEPTGDFVIETQDGTVQNSGNVYTLSAAGTYTLQGSLTGQIVVDAADADVALVLNGASIVYDQDSPIKVLAANGVDISAKEGTDNIVEDKRAAKTVDAEDQGEGAISAKCDLKLKGKGTLVVSAGYNNGVHTTKDLTIKNLALKVTAVNNAIKGKNSVTIESGSIVAISTKGDGVKTENSDLSDKGKQRGTITMADGALTVYAAGDGIQAAYDVVIEGGTITVYTAQYSAYTQTNDCTSYKGIKANNQLSITGGTLTIHSYDDGLHADYGNTLQNGDKGKGNITIAGGSIEISVYSPTTTTAMGRMGPRGGGWGQQQQTAKGNDGIHADNTLTVTGGTIVVDSAYEGLEATFLVFEGGSTTVYATDDGINAAAKVSNAPCITISGGLLDITVPTNGDTDGIDSNNAYVQTGGVVIVKGPGSASGAMGGGAFALDAEKSITIKGGTLIVFGGIERTPSTSNVTKTVCSSQTVAAGSHTVTVGGNQYTTQLKYQTGGCVVYSDGGSATLK